jgi:hypothetical protein
MREHLGLAVPAAAGGVLAGEGCATICGSPSAAVGGGQCDDTTSGYTMRPGRQAARGNGGKCLSGISRTALRQSVAPRPDVVMGARGSDQVARTSAPCSRPMSARRNTRLKRSWQEADTCSSSVELTLITVTSPAARMVALRLAPCT